MIKFMRTELSSRRTSGAVAVLSLYVERVGIIALVHIAPNYSRISVKVCISSVLVLDQKLSANLTEFSHVG